MTINTSVVYEHMQESLDDNTSIVVHQGGTRCFVGDTLVRTSTGLVPIKDVKEGDLVWSLNEVTHKLELKRVRNKYKYEHTWQRLVKFIREGDSIISNEGHEFYYGGQWVRNTELAKRVLERNKRSLSNKQHGSIEVDELQTDRKTTCDETSVGCEWLPPNNDIERGQVFYSEDAPTCSGSFCGQSVEQTASKSHRPQSGEQQSGKSRVGNSQREYKPHDESGAANIQQRGEERDGEIDRTASQGNKGKVPAISCDSESSCEGVQGISGNYQGRTLPQMEAREIELHEILDVHQYDAVEKVYDLGVSDNHNYLVTEDNIIVHNSGKTYNILIWLIVKAMGEWNGEIIDIGRKTFPSLRFSVMSDFFEILKENKLYFEDYHNKTENTYTLSGNLFRFFSVDQEQKIRGSKRSYLFLNEANEFDYDDFRQLNQRTEKMTILDYNPSDEYHWIYENILTRDDVKFFKTTFRDNPFLDKRIREEIYRYKDTDPNYWRIYGLGEKGLSETTIFTAWEYADKYEGEGQEIYGMDFGFNDPTTLVRAKYHKEGGVVFDQLMNETKLTSDDMLERLNALVAQGKLTKTSTIIADCARPEVIEDLCRGGFNVHSCIKEKGSILRDINFMKMHKIFITKDSVDLIKEIKSYKWKVDKVGKTLDEPVGLNDHLLDAARYALNKIIRMKEYATPFIGRARIFG